MWAWLLLLPIGIAWGFSGGVYVASLVAKGVQTEAAVLEPPLADQTARFDLAGTTLLSPVPSPTTTPQPTGPRTRSAVNMHTAPGEQTPVIGVLSAGTELNVVGRDQAARWIAVEFPPGSTLIVWLPVGEIHGLETIESLKVRPES